MRNQLFIIAAAGILMFTAVSCRKPYEKHYDLSVDALSYVLPYTGSTFVVYVYCSSSWTAELDREADWIRIVPGTEGGTGTGAVRIVCKDNEDVLREVNLLLRSGDFIQTVNISQKYNSVHMEVE